MRDDGLEPSAVTSLLAKLGTSEPVLPQRDLKALADSFDFDKVGRAPARFDDGELIALNAKILHETPFDDVANRLKVLGVSSALWDVVKGNLERVEDAKEWLDVISGNIDPLIEDTEFTNQAAALVPDNPLTDESWSAFTSAVKATTGAKGKALFMPLRMALTGRSRGPEMGPLFALIGADKARARLSGSRG